MSATRGPAWSVVKEILAAAMARPAHERAAFLDEACGEDGDLRAEVEALLAEHDSEGPFDAMEAELHELVGVGRSLEPGDEIGRFRIIEELGRGGMGTVYLAERDGADFEQRVAIKLVEGGLAKEELGRRLRAERRILAALDHPCIARFLDGDLTADGQPYLVMEHVDGTPIDDFADRARLDVGERLELFGAVLDAVQCAHQRLIVHQDIKPSNILVRRDRTVKLLDFGVARLLGDDGSVGGAVSGGHTPGYASPEQRRGEPATLASDVYSLGVLLHVLVTGERPPSTGVPAPSSVTVSEATAGARKTTPERLRARLSGDLDAIVLRALAADPSRRYATAEQLDADLRAHREHRPVRARGSGRRYRAAKFLRRNRLPVGAAAALVVTLVGGLAATATQARRAAEQARAAATERDLSQQVSDLLIGMFELSNPGVVLGESITAREILDRAVVEVDRTLGDQPAAHARMLLEIGRIYRTLGLTEPTTRAAERSLALYADLPEASVDEWAGPMRLVAGLRADAGDPDAAVELLGDVLSRQRAGLPEAAVAVAETLNQLGGQLRVLARYPEAEAAWSEAIELVGVGERDDLTVQILYGLALSSHDQGDFSTAERRFREAVALVPASGPADGAPDSPIAARSRHLLGQLLMVRGELEESERLLEEALATQTRLFEPGHPDRLATLKSLATLRVNDDRHGEAVSLLEEALEIETAALGAGHHEVARTGYILGVALLSVGREAEGARLIERTVEVYDEEWGPTHPYLVAATHALSLAREDVGDLGGASEAALRSVEVARANFGDHHPFVVRGRAQIGRLAHARGELDSALGTLRAALTDAEGTVDPDNRIVVRARISLGDVLRETGALDESEVVLREALTSARAGESERSLLLADAEHLLGMTLAARGERPEAITLLQSALARREAVLPAGHRDVRSARAALARVAGGDDGPAG